jgi:chaperonin cofactor prefoldin
LKEIQQSIAKLNIDSADKEKLSKEVSTLNKEQRSLQDKVDEFERELENEKVKKRQIEREI